MPETFYISPELTPQELAMLQTGGGSDSSGSSGSSNSETGCSQNSNCVKSGNLLAKDDWYHPSKGKESPIEWETTGGQFQVKVQTDFSTNPPTPPHPNENAPLSAPRHKYDILTKCECYTDFHLEVQFRCPNMRDDWNCQAGINSFTKGAKGSPCGAPLYGTANWGNSGIYLQNSYEIQIHDSYIETPVWDVQKENLILSDKRSCKLLKTTMCGAVYNRQAPLFGITNQAGLKKVFHDHFKKAVNTSPENYTPAGEWNRMDIYFMAPRYNQDGTKAKRATVAIILNKTSDDDSSGDRVIWRFGIPSKTSDSRKNELNYGFKPDSHYIDHDYNVMCGPIGIQEHDNKIQYKTIKINPNWKPKKSSVFDPDWQISASGFGS